MVEREKISALPCGTHLRIIPCWPLENNSNSLLGVAVDHAKTSPVIIQLSPEGEVNSGGYIPRREASRYICTALHRP